MNEKNHQNGRFTTFLVTLLVGLSLAQILVSLRLAGRGQDLAALEEEARSLSQENQRMRSQLSEAAALSKIASTAAELGFIKPEKLLFLTPQIPVAQNQ